MITRLGAAQGEGAESRVEAGAAENEGRPTSLTKLTQHLILEIGRAHV